MLCLTYYSLKNIEIKVSQFYTKKCSTAQLFSKEPLFIMFWIQRVRLF